jgi:hypothetical protein
MNASFLAQLEDILQGINSGFIPVHPIIFFRMKNIGIAPVFMGPWREVVRSGFGEVMARSRKLARSELTISL